MVEKQERGLKKEYRETSVERVMGSKALYLQEKARDVGYSKKISMQHARKSKNTDCTCKMFADTSRNFLRISRFPLTPKSDSHFFQTSKFHVLF